ncbi:MAG TPA: DUF484 family protein [Ottowia sp.]|uniref:DUF484 family protein n=1 Tax=Ottowia sp. TaxID=1898956 RepID=UPI0011D95C33|nr:DUF484 family protein [Ottowia sp.]MCZ2089631.1 DUF484 family protein [Burkholderiales bacterium]TXI21926.1 MAG: DUF484 family protein [Ottowia sp.]HNI85604.1 DUF484 family protein [Ottowia sp.]HNJ45033.1 DUF484 family protein [Ottowia sp.]HNK53584.1 DUF484 family protein [Ottowia sp.]
MTTPATPPITEEDIAEFLIHTPGFFERHAELLTAVQLTSPHGGRAVSLQERQAEMLRDKIKLLEQRLMEMMRHGNENMLIADRMLRWARQMFLVARPVDLPAVLVSEIRSQFSVPQAALKLWDVAEVYAGEPFAQGASEDVRSLASSLGVPYCGVNAGFDAVQWLDDPEAAASLALIPLRAGAAGPAFGLLILASPDSQRYQAGMATDFLERIAELASAALSRVRDD